MSAAEETLAFQLIRAGIDFEREYRFASPRRWRFDFILFGTGLVPELAVEVEGGSYTGGHKRGKAYESDCEKSNAAVLQRWRVLRFTPAMVEDGRALAVIRQALGMEAAA